MGVLVVHARAQADASVEVEFASSSTVRARSGLIATAVAYSPGYSGVEQLIGRGVRYGSPSREAAGLARRLVAVVGGANSAGRAARHSAWASGVSSTTGTLGSPSRAGCWPRSSNEPIVRPSISCPITS